MMMIEWLIYKLYDIIYELNIHGDAHLMIMISMILIN
jgi:hypothetical protein